MERELPMFPLGTVLFPHAVLPLQVFEPRYHMLVERCLAGDRELGVVLIERGHEVGGGDSRFDVGTLARIEQAGQLPNGRLVLVIVGTERLRVTEWLPDDPHPIARVGPLADAGDVAAGRVTRVDDLLRRVLAMRAELGDPVPALDFELDDDPRRASYQTCALAPIGPLDAQRLLELDDAGERLTALEAMLEEERTVLELRLSGA